MITKIKFKISPYRKDGHVPSNFDGRLSRYWQRQYYDLFKGWD